MDFFVFDTPPTTAIYPNRLEDKKRVEQTLGLTEYPSGRVKFFTPKFELFAESYERIVYGDHGPYIEFNRTDIIIDLVRKFDRPCPVDAYYEWLTPSDLSDMKVYDQRRTVEHIKNPPIGGFQGNRTEGYADYKVGMIYVSPYEFGKIEKL